MKLKKIQKIILVILVVLLALSTVLLFVPLGGFKKAKPKKTSLPSESFSTSTQRKFTPPPGPPKIKGPSGPPPGWEKEKK